MGPLRNGLILAVLPGPAWAEVCDKIRPMWTPGTPATAWDEMLHLLASPISLALLAATALAVRFRSQWGALGVVVAWTVWTSLIAFADDDDAVQQLATAEGCIGPPTLFLGLITAICVATILYTVPRPSRPD